MEKRPTWNQLTWPELLEVLAIGRIDFKSAGAKRVNFPRARSAHDVHEQGPNGKYRKIPAGKPLREYLLGNGWSATPNSKTRKYRWCVSKLGEMPFFAATLTQAAAKAQVRE